MLPGTPISLQASNKFHVIKGAKKSTNFEGNNLDVILVRDAFHHFSAKKRMLKSIKKSMHPEGRVIVSEHVIESTLPDDRCSKIMNKADIIAAFSGQGFKLDSLVEEGEEYVFVFKRK